MKQRYRRKQFWWTWRWDVYNLFSNTYKYYDWGIGRIKHQTKH